MTADGERARPSGAVPPGERDAVQPSRLLANRRIQARREILAHRDDRAAGRLPHPRQRAGPGNGGGGDCLGRACGSGDGTGGDNDAYYSSIVKSQIEAAIRRDEKLRFATYRLRVTFQLDGAGHVTRASIGSFEGDAEARAEVARVLQEVSTNDAPPAEMTAKTFTVSITEHARG